MMMMILIFGLYNHLLLSYNFYLLNTRLYSYMITCMNFIFIYLIRMLVLFNKKDRGDGTQIYKMTCIVS